MFHSVTLIPVVEKKKTKKKAPPMLAKRTHRVSKRSLSRALTGGS